jgi:RNA polymerase sigma-70 factor (ECF subfamily)
LLSPPAAQCCRGAAVKRWLIGIAWRQASHYAERAYRRHEVPKRDPTAFSHAHSPSPFDQINAREELCTLSRIEPRFRVVLWFVALGWQVNEIAAELGENPNTAQNRLRIARQQVVRFLVRWRRMGNGREAKSNDEVELMHEPSWAVHEPM